VQNEQVVLRKGYGMANLELGVPVDPGHVFRICSITKQFTAVAILQLVDAGKVRLDDDLHLYLPDYPTGAAKVTLAQVLGHTAGIPSIESLAEWKKTWREDRTLDQLLEVTKNTPLDFPPGTNFHYSNKGYVLLGAVIEKVSGQTYADYVRTHLFQPAGMTHSDYDSATQLIPHRAAGYVRENKSWVNAPYISMTQPYSSGSLVSSVDDMWRWEQALSSGKLIGSALLAQAQTAGQLPDGRSTNCGFGWEVTQLGAHTVLQHAGGMPGFCAHAMKVRDAGLFIVVLCNMSEPSQTPRTLTHRIARLLLNEPKSSYTVPPASLEDYVGTYRVAPGQQLVISVVDGKLIGRLGGKRSLHPVDVDTFATADSDMRFTFLRNADHKVDRVLARPDAPGPGLEWSRE
jgi:CubicO group peptidase (beta-lactamase class C family)